jgi:hypothetical protein
MKKIKLRIMLIKRHYMPGKGLIMVITKIANKKSGTEKAVVAEEIALFPRQFVGFELSSVFAELHPTFNG